MTKKTSKTMIEFYSGSKQISETFKKRGYKTLSIDNNPKLKPDLCLDVLQLTLKDIPEEFRNPDVIWFSPPCTTFSVCTISKNFKNNQPISSSCYVGLALAYRCLELIKMLNPTYWFIENPRGMLRKQHFMPNNLLKTVTYCQYGDKNQKPTDIWTNAQHWIPKKPCVPGGNCHEYQPRTYKSKVRHGVVGLGVQGLANAFERSKIPFKLCEEIVDVCDYKIKTYQQNLNFEFNITKVIQSD